VIVREYLTGRADDHAGAGRSRALVLQHGVDVDDTDLLRGRRLAGHVCGRLGGIRAGGGATPAADHGRLAAGRGIDAQRQCRPGGDCSDPGRDRGCAAAARCRRRLLLPRLSHVDRRRLRHRQLPLVPSRGCATSDIQWATRSWRLAERRLWVS